MLDELKNYLDITWNDEKTDSKLAGIIERATAILQSYAGAVIDFSANPDKKQLLFDCCRYIWNNAFEDFKNNFSSELLMLRAEYQVQKNEKI